MAYYLIQNDIYELWSSLSEYSFRDLYDTLEYKQRDLDMDKQLVDMLLHIIYGMEQKGQKFPSSAQELYELLSNQVNLYSSL